MGYAPVSASLGVELGVAFVGTDSGSRLAAACGLATSWELAQHFDLVNLFPEPDAPLDRARSVRRARAIVREVVVGRCREVVLLSAPVAEAFGVPYHPLMTWERRRERDWLFKVASAPHPSGLVRWHNEPANRYEYTTFLRTLAGQE